MNTDWYMGHLLRDPGTVVRTLFAIPDRRIDRDLIAAARDLKGFTRNFWNERTLRRGATCPRIAALHLHKRMILAAIHSLADATRDRSVLLADETVLVVADLASRAAQFVAGGRLAEIYREMAAIARREGVGDGVSWITDVPIPAEHGALIDESEALKAKIRDTVFVATLRAYRFLDLARWFEADPDGFRDMNQRLAFSQPRGDRPLRMGEGLNPEIP